jgi:hypothetical protein
MIDRGVIYPYGYQFRKKGLSQKSTFFFWDSPKWEEMAGNGQKINALSQNRQEKRPKVGEEKGAVCF